MGEFTHLPGVIVMIVCEFFLISLTVIYFHNRSRLRPNNHQPVSLTLFQSFFNGKPFGVTYKSNFGGVWDIMLLCTRILSFLYFLVVSCIMNYEKNDGFNYKYFTQWNIDWICSFYLLAIICSCVGLSHEKNQGLSTKIHHNSRQEEGTEEWPQWIQVLSNGTQVIFEVTGGSALFVTVVAFAVLNPRFEFWNVSNHFVTSLAILLELSLNSMPVRWEHLVFNLAWALVYLIFIWPAVALDTVKFWPYGFLYTDTAVAYAFYTALVVVNIFFYFVWLGLARLKGRYLVLGRDPGSAASDSRQSSGDASVESTSKGGAEDIRPAESGSSSGSGSGAGLKPALADSFNSDPGQGVELV